MKLLGFFVYYYKLSDCTQLYTLEIDNCTSLESSKIRDIASLTKIKVLKLNQHFNLQDKDLRYPKNFSGLTSLTLDHSEQLTDACLQTIGCFKLFKHLYLKFSKITDQFLIGIIPFKKTLETLDLEFSKK